MAKPFLILQLRPEDETADNELDAIRLYGGLAPAETVRRRVEQEGLDGIDLNAYAAIIVGGSPFDVSKPPAQKSRVQRSVESGFQRLFDQVVAQDFPFLGCCSGNGLLGNYCGASISNRYGEDVGGTDIRLTDAGLKDPLLQGLPPTFRVLVGHKEACDAIPPGCTLLATNDRCPVQMFRLKTNIYATQFHPEGDAAGFTVRINVYRHHGYFPPAMAETLIDRIALEKTPDAQRILRRFVKRYRN
ncbi:MAG: glutamine amidotransferase [Gammaproteobacteria bacterium]|nr:glutamine amidotransferase [Pseudomonadales bacterium]MCP5346983.1 glutamine amidotransferase [Pseudomonadales bacterium]